ncbi:MAG TPA: PASTA domain-containing protein [Saprospiraceae bacterium]|nr:PASTA domain-containing protein [Saprospiraceae bacterium]HMP26159.1 PASTA domain-containing protein [Saprospiraceae bacterium]
MKIKVGIFFGGPSREREIAFAGGRTVYDNLNKTLFEPIPIFVDSHRNFILLDWKNIYKGSIRDFYPPVKFLPPSPHEFQVYLESLGALSEEDQAAMIAEVGEKILLEDLPQYINIAFLALHGAYGEDGQLQQQLEDLNIPYTGSGVRSSQIGMDKVWQKQLMTELGFACPAIRVFDRSDWLAAQVADLYQEAIATVGFPMVIRPANQGSSIGVSIIEEDGGLEGFEEAVNRAFFREVIPVDRWQRSSEYERIDQVRLLADIRDGLGFPMDVSFHEEKNTFYHPEPLLTYLNTAAMRADAGAGVFVLEGHAREEQVIAEAFIRGKEFSCIVIRREDGTAVGLPPTEIVKGSEVFDYRSKYLPGLSRKLTPIDLPDAQINAIRREAERLFVELGFHVYARIDGFITPENDIFLNDPNTTSGMLPSSFFFHQAAEIGLNPSQFLTFILRISLQERLREHPHQLAWRSLLQLLDEQIQALQSAVARHRHIAVVLGGYSFERHISVESGRNVYEKLASSDKYDPMPVFLTGENGNYQLYRLPINLLLKDNADDIKDKILHFRAHPVIEEIKAQCADVTRKYGSPDVIFVPQALSLADLKTKVDGVFIALHGRPGEDGQLQLELDQLGLPYNGSDAVSSAITINKHVTLQTLKRNGFQVTEQMVLKKTDYESSPEACFNRIESRFRYPFVAKPVDDGCSSAVKVINTREQLEAFVRLMYRPVGQEGEEARRVLKLKPKEEFPRKGEILFETLIAANGAVQFMEITGGLLTHFEPDGSIRYEMFEPSETLATGEVLSLEEKFLAGEGQNITPARFQPDYEQIARKVKADLEKAARILNVRGYARIDAFVRVYEDQRVETIIIEVNSLPGMTPATAIFHQAALNGYKPYQLIDQLLTFGFQSKQREALPQAEPEPTPADDVLTVKETQAWAPLGHTASPSEPDPKRTLAETREEWVARLRKISPFSLPLILENIRGIARNVWAFLSSRIFLRNFIAWAAMIVALLFVANLLLRLYTRHNESVQVGNYIGMTLLEAERRAKDRSFRVVITDSIYIVDKAPNMVLDQDPKPLSRVKQRRRIYLTVTKSTPDMVTLPELIGSYSYAQYTRKLAQLNLRFVVRERQFDSKLEENTILHFYHNDRKITDADLRNGVRVPMGSTLEFVVTERSSGFVEIPDLVCRTYSAAQFLISANNLSVGNVYGDVEDRSSAYIWKQEPAYEPGQNIRMGEQISIYLTQERPAGCPAEEGFEE